MGKRDRRSGAYRRSRRSGLLLFLPKTFDCFVTVKSAQNSNMLAKPRIYVSFQLHKSSFIQFYTHNLSNILLSIEIKLKRGGHVKEGLVN